MIVNLDPSYNCRLPALSSAQTVPGFGGVPVPCPAGHSLLCLFSFLTWHTGGVSVFPCGRYPFKALLVLSLFVSTAFPHFAQCPIVPDACSLLESLQPSDELIYAGWWWWWIVGWFLQTYSYSLEFPGRVAFEVHVRTSENTQDCS